MGVRRLTPEEWSNDRHTDGLVVDAQITTQAANEITQAANETTQSDSSKPT